jgi:hypothetical protein
VTLFRFNPLMNPETRPFVDGNRRKIGLNVSGGNDQTTFYLSGETDQEQGIFEPNRFDRVNLRANLNSRLADQLNVALRTGYVRSFIEMPQNDNNFTGVHLNGNLGWPPRTLWTRRRARLVLADAGADLRGGGGAGDQPLHLGRQRELRAAHLAQLRRHRRPRPGGSPRQRVHRAGSTR